MTQPKAWREAGDVTELRVQLKYRELGYVLLSPVTSSSYTPFDLVLYRDGVFKRVQIKTGYKSNKPASTLSFHTRSSNGVCYHGSIDVFAVVDPLHLSIYEVPVSVIGPEQTRATLSFLADPRLSALRASQFKLE